MIKVLSVKCNNDFKYCKKVFEKNNIYKAYISKNGYIVINDKARVYFNNRRPGMLKFETFTKGFRKNFEIVEENLVKNKLELNKFISTIE